jgi:hypothetical protein
MKPRRAELVIGHEKAPIGYALTREGLTGIQIALEQNLAGDTLALWDAMVAKLQLYADGIPGAEELSTGSEAWWSAVIALTSECGIRVQGVHEVTGAI